MCLFNPNSRHAQAPRSKRLRPLVLPDGSKSFASPEAGATLIEFAVSVVVLLMIVFGIMDCSRALYVDHYVRFSAEEAARYAMVRGSSWKNAACTTVWTESCTASSSNVTSLVQSITPPGVNTGSNLAVTTTWTGMTPAGSSCGTTVNYPGCVVQVQVSYNFNFVLPFLPKNALVLSSKSAVAISQ